MKGVAIVDASRIDALCFIERDVPRPGPGEVLVRIKAVSLNFRDLLVIEGSRDIRLPLVPLSGGTSATWIPAMPWMSL